MPANLVARRPTEITTALADAQAKLRQVAVIHETPPQLYAPETLARFENLLREALVGDVGVARAYLHALVARVVVGADGGVEVIAKLPAAVAATAANDEGAGLGKVPAVS